MAYQHRFTQAAIAIKNSTAKKITPMLVASLPLLTVLGSASLLTGCGFHLRGYDAPMQFDVAKTAILIEDNRISFPLKLPLTRRLQALGVDVVDGISMIESAANSSVNNTTAEPIATINISNVRFKRYELVGVLTEIRLVLSADVSYQVMENGKLVTLTNPIQVDRSYQYNEASVSTDDQQGDQTRDWLYDTLARRITDQYVALSLPKVPSKNAKIPVQTGKGSASTAVVLPTP